MSVGTTVGSDLPYIWNVQLIENYLLLPFLVWGIWRIRKFKINLLFALIVLVPIIVITFLWSSHWSYRVILLIPINVFEAIGLSGLLEWITKKGGI